MTWQMLSFLNVSLPSASGSRDKMSVLPWWLNDLPKMTMLMYNSFNKMPLTKEGRSGDTSILNCTAFFESVVLFHAMTIS